MASVFELFDEEAVIFYETIGRCYKKAADVEMSCYWYASISRRNWHL